MRNFKSAILAAVFVLAIGFAQTSLAKFKEVVKADKNYDFKAVETIVMLPILSEKVDFGKVDPDRMHKIQSALAKTKNELRKQMVEGMNLSNPNKKFSYKLLNKKRTTLLVEYHIEKFDNGNIVKRNVLPFGGKAEVAIRAIFKDGQTKNTVAEVMSSAKDGGGGMAKTDSDVLFMAAKMADAGIFKFMKKITGLEYDSTANLGKKAKLGLKGYGDVMSTEKEEKEVMKKKAGK